MKLQVCALALSVGVTGAAFGQESPQRSLLDLYRSGCNAELFRDHPNAVGFATVGDVHGKRFPHLMVEVTNVFVTLDAMVDEAGLTGSDLREIRVSAITLDNLSEIESSLSSDARFHGLPVTYEVVKSLPVPWARVGIYAVGEKSDVSTRLLQQFGSSETSTGKSEACSGTWMVPG